jgi:hypothetical protein
MTILGRRLVDDYLSEVADFAKGVATVSPTISHGLFELLGCPYAPAQPGHIIEPHQRDPDAVEYLPEVLIAALSVPGAVTEVTSLLAGVSRAGALSTFVQNPEHAYNLAFALINHVEYIELHSHHFLDLYVISDVCSLLNEWLKPRTKWAMTPPAHTLCQYFFGDTWCAVALPPVSEHKNHPGTIVNQTLGAIVAAQHPPLLPGLCPSQADPTALDLPCDVGYA